MKKYFVFFSIISGSAILYLLFPIHSKRHFVTIQKGKFSLDGNFFYPVALNYIAEMQTNGNELWPCPTPDYDSGLPHPKTKDSTLMQLQADMDLIKEMGFNVVRFVGIGEEVIDEKNGSLSVRGRWGERNKSFALSTDADYKTYFMAVKELFNVVNKAGLKAIFLIKMRSEVKTTEDFLRRLATEFRKDTTLMAYDLFNEPLYFDSIHHRNKEDVYEITRQWQKIVAMYAPYQLSTIGLEGIREVFAWDPNILNVDFLSMHPYEYEPEQVRNEIYWYGKYIKKPWMLGETAIPADNDTVPYEEQKQFAIKTLKQTANCGAIGYSWWQYKDVDWHFFHANYMGVINRKGETKTKTDKVVNGTVKPLAEAFETYHYNPNRDSCVCLSNYYNYSQHKTFRITGYLTDQNSKPIKGGVVLAWNEWWSHSYHTISKDDGSFELLSNFPFYHWMASATEYSMVRADILPDTARKYADTIPTIDIGTLKIRKLRFLPLRHFFHHYDAKK